MLISKVRKSSLLLHLHSEIIQDAVDFDVKAVEVTEMMFDIREPKILVKLVRPKLYIIMIGDIDLIEETDPILQY